ncbi:MAG: tRNA sulfurtransferase [Candidatus Nanohalobium sp.]
MDCVLVRYGEIGTKSGHVRGQMAAVLRQRVADRLQFEGIEYGKVSDVPGRVVVRGCDAGRAARVLDSVPGVASVSPAVRVDAGMESIKSAAKGFEYGDTFGVDAVTAFTDMSSRSIKEELGAYVEELKGLDVDLDDPDTWLEVEVRDEDAYVFTERFEGVGGLPVGTQDCYAALISGGIDSPVAAFQVMKRGADIVPVYFYNRPVSAEDHLIRFEEAVRELRKFHPGKDWSYLVVDMKEVNEELMKVDKGRMVLHRRIMFRVAEELSESRGLKGIVTGESLGQKSSQTSQNLKMTSRAVDLPVMRPLLSFNKEEITGKAREIGTFELAEVNSACRTMAPESPSTALKGSQLEELRKKTDTDELVEKALETVEERKLD